MKWNRNICYFIIKIPTGKRVIKKSSLNNLGMQISEHKLQCSAVTSRRQMVKQKKKIENKKSKKNPHLTSHQDDRICFDNRRHFVI